MLLRALRGRILARPSRHFVWLLATARPRSSLSNIRMLLTGLTPPDLWKRLSETQRTSSWWVIFLTGTEWRTFTGEQTLLCRSIVLKDWALLSRRECCVVYPSSRLIGPATRIF